MIAFGPVPSRRLGHSIGVNTIPPKICTYSCVYCQLGRSLKMQVVREVFYEPDAIARDVERKVTDAANNGESIDYLTFVPDGEPTLDRNLGQEIDLLKPLGLKIAVITNASLLWHAEIREEVGKADWVSVKVDAVTQAIWRKIDRPYGTLRCDRVLEGIETFAQGFRGTLTTETMLVQGVNDIPEVISRIAAFLRKIGPAVSYLAIPTRPPAEPWALPASEQVINSAYQVFREHGLKVEYLLGYEGNAFAFTGNIEADLLSITAVHPMREEAVRTLLAKAGADWHVVDTLLADGTLLAVPYGGNQFYMRTLGR
ncbi:radical SAM protein [candidate division KSB3 bacterium]|uniref:Radical SAM protein n=1 Tax=candidate division KSB3 bacterium TaxID=2044937 RepID=A0A9D5Q7F8_9BACT|nr:radical SAM protein [candidate division KSB3 bacterium]MBD3326398.1 radical SAM protein [candidate division KSB3 bacterium]